MKNDDGENEKSEWRINSLETSRRINPFLIYQHQKSRPSVEFFSCVLVMHSEYLSFHFLRSFTLSSASFHQINLGKSFAQKLVHKVLKPAQKKMTFVESISDVSGYLRNACE